MYRIYRIDPWSREVHSTYDTKEEAEAVLEEIRDAMKAGKSYMKDKWTDFIIKGDSVMEEEYSSKTDGSIIELNKLSIDDLEKELRAMDKDELIQTCKGAIWASCMLSEVLEEKNK